jgi:flagellar hook protein FlgE
MSLDTALSGLLSAQAGLNVVSNDLANVSTTGFKSGSAEFQAEYSVGSANAPGEGASEQFILQDFQQGNLGSPTGNPLDLAVQGNGYFIVQQAGESLYTRDGAFVLGASGQLQTASGNAVLGFGVNNNGTSNGILAPLTISTGGEAANATTSVGLSALLNSADAAIPAATAFNPANATTYDESTSVTAYDSLGNANHVQLYFIKQPASASASAKAPAAWKVMAQQENANGSAVGASQTLTTLTFNPNGSVATGGSATLPVNFGAGGGSATIAFNFAGTTLGAQSFSVASLTNNGYAAGAYLGPTISSTGVVQATYTNGQSKTVGTIAVANFINNQGLVPVDGNMFTASTTSGQPVVNSPGTGVAGSLVSGQLEDSNVQTSSALVELLKFQEAYQSDTSVLQTEQQDSQKLMQL